MNNNRAGAGGVVMLLGYMLAMPLQGADGPPAADDLLYEDEAARSSATITQVMPDASKTQVTLDAVRRIRIKQDILIIEWGNTVTTLLPKRYVSAMTVNKRAPATAPKPAAN